MAQETSALWRELREKSDTRAEYKFDIDGVEYGPDTQIDHSVEHGLWESFGIGNAAIASLKLTILADNIPRGATIRRYIRLVNGDRASEWLPKGVFFANRRPHEDGVWSIEAYDVMRKAETAWAPRDDLQFPLTMRAAVDEFCRLMDCELDPRTVINPAYTLDYPADYTIRQELQYIAAAHGGNWIITDEGKLLLVPLISAPPETHYLVTEHGAAITLGGVRILV